MPEGVVIGAGPAGLFAALELSRSKIDTLVIDQGMDVSQRLCPLKSKGYCMHCHPCHIMCGVGGAGTYSDGLLNLHPSIGGDLTKLAGEDAWNLIETIDSTFLKYGAPKEAMEPKAEDAEMLRRKAAAAGARFIAIKQRHMGSDKTPEIISAFKKDLVQKGVKFLLNTTFVDLII